ncbi:MAG: FAD-dependent oxidoreductase [Thermomicrobiales bacterium]
MEVLHADVVIVGAGSGGFGAALQLARGCPAASIVVIEVGEQFGGTSTIGGVNCWEPGVAGLGVHYALYERLANQPLAVGVGRSTHYFRPEEPWGFSQVDPTATYEQSLRSSGLSAEAVRRVHFEPDAMSAAMHSLLSETGNVDIRYRTRFVQARVSGRGITSVIVQSLDGRDTYEIDAALFVDCSGGIHLASAAGCATAFGEDPAVRYGEPSAPADAHPIVNGISQIFRVEPVATPRIEALPPQATPPETLRWATENHPATQINEYPNGDLNINTLPIMQGGEFHALPYQEAVRICQARVYVHWHRLQSTHGFDRYRFKALFPLVGIRESNRLIGQYVLREQDVRAGILHQPQQDTIIACADHPLDTHGKTNVTGPRVSDLAQPYGVPYACLLPREIDNLIVASRGASFSHIAAASCRLSRSMMALGEAAGVATVLALAGGRSYSGVSVAAIREQLRIPELIDTIVRVWGLVPDRATGHLPTAVA